MRFTNHLMMRMNTNKFLKQELKKAKLIKIKLALETNQQLKKIKIPDNMMIKRTQIKRKIKQEQNIQDKKKFINKSLKNLIL